MALGSWGGDPDRTDPNLSIIDGSTCDGGRNSGHWCDPAYDEIVRRQATVLDEQQRQQLVFEAQARFQEALPWWQVSHETFGITYNADKWAGVVSPSPIPPHETVVDPWLQLRPKGDDRTLDWAHFEDLRTYNILSETASMGWLRFIYDPFLRFDDHGDLMPWAATSWKFVDDTTIELTLRDGMTFHDGRPVTADDAAFSINYLLEWQPPASSFALEGMEGAEVHTHPHEQISYVLSGRLLAMVGGEEKELLPGQAVHNPPNVPHNVRALEDSVILSCKSIVGGVGHRI